MDTQSICHLKDFAKFTTDHTLARKLREVSQRFSKKRSTLVLTGKTVELPGKIEHTMVRYHLNLPERKELRAVLETVLRSLTEAKRVNVEMDKVGMEELVNALVGMTLNQAR